MDFKHLAVPNSCKCFNLFQFEVKLGSRSKSQDTSSHWTFCDSMLASAFQSCCLPLHVRSFLFREFQEANPSSKDKWHKDLLRPSTTQHPKAQHENQLAMYEPLPSPHQSHSQNDPKTLPGPRPSLLAASTVAPAEISCSTTAAWPSRAARCSAVRPRCRGCDADGGAAAAAVEKQSVAMGCFSGLLGKIIGRKYQIRQVKLILLYLLVWGMAKNKRNNHRKICSCCCSIVLLKILKQLHLTFATSCVACLETISWITVDYPSADKYRFLKLRNNKR